MKLYYEWGIKQINKYGEELCGDSVSISRKSDSVTLSLSDGLGSGVKANILATLTTQIAMHLLENSLPLGEVVQTLSETLPFDSTRKLAYSTFVIAQFMTPGIARIVEFDTPSTIFLRGRKVQKIPYEEKLIGNKTIHEVALELQDGDWIIFVSDGVLNAGIGGVYPLGWGWEETVHFLEKHVHRDLSAEEVAARVAETVCELYAGKPGDDVSIAAIKVRHKMAATVFTGPPEDRRRDKEVVSSFLRRLGKLVICGGTTAKIVARHLGQPLEVDLSTMTKDVPPQANIKGIDLVSEGILTLTRVNQMLKAGANKKTVMFQNDGAANLLRLLLSVDEVHFLVGQAVNPAHQNPELPHELGIRHKVVEEIATELKKRGQEVYIELT